MAKATVSRRSIEPDAIVRYHSDADAALRAYYAPERTPDTQRFLGYTFDQMTAERQARLGELDIASSFMILTTVEAAFRIDYIQRCRLKRKDQVSRAFRDLFKEKAKQEKAKRASLEDDILEIWKRHAIIPARLISDLKAVFKYRHWIAHGRYWEPKLGRAYEFADVYALVMTTFKQFPFIDV